jgi:hypothetical protein
MCAGCYAKFGFPKIVTPETVRAARLAAQVYEFSGVGGNLHCELDDWNLEDKYFGEPEMDVWRTDSTADQLAVERECYAALRALPLLERVSAVALFRPYVANAPRLKMPAFWHFQR